MSPALSGENPPAKAGAEAEAHSELRAKAEPVSRAARETSGAVGTAVPTSQSPFIESGGDPAAWARERRLPSIGTRPAHLRLNTRSQSIEHRPVTPARIAPGRLLKMADVERETSLHRATIYRRIAADDFPRPIALGPRRVAWREADIEAWKATLALKEPENCE